MSFFESLSSGRSNEKKEMYWNEFLIREREMLNVFDGTIRGKVRVTEATALCPIGVLQISQLRAKILSKLFTTNSHFLEEKLDLIQNETLKMVISSELQKIADSRP